MTNISTWRSSGGRIKGSTRKTLQAMPREGSRLRTTYDMLMNNPATPLLTRDLFSGDARGSCSRTLEVLREYGLDVRLFNRGRGKGNPGSWWLVGYTDAAGGYVDCLANTLEREDSDGL